MPRLLLLLLPMAAFGGGWWFGAGESGTTKALRAEVAALEETVARRDLQLEMLRARSRVARLEVLDQFPDPSRRSGLTTRIRFTEVAADGSPLGPAQDFDIDGSLVYLDAQVIKFDDAFVESQDLLRGSSMLLFRRIFGEYQSPAEGFALDAAGERPAGYRAEAGLPEYQRDLWERFWEYANDPEVARRSGVRAMHGEAPYIKLAPERSYDVELRHAGGLDIRAVE
jgi:hypothetical protein